MTGRRPLLAAGTLAIVSISLLGLAITHGWLGPDAGRGSEFCEHAATGCVVQPANTWSNLGFVLAGLVIAWHARRPEGALAGSAGLATAYALLAVALGPASAAMHATQSALGGRLDLLSMYLIAAFILAHAVTSAVAGGGGLFTVVFVVAVVAAEVLASAPVRVPWLGHPGNAAFAMLLVVALAFGELARRRGRLRTHLGWVGAALGSILLALGLWSISHSHGPWCDPTSLLQGHAAWHLLCALSTYCLYRAWRSAPGHAGAP